MITCGAVKNTFLFRRLFLSSDEPDGEHQYKNNKTEQAQGELIPFALFRMAGHKQYVEQNNATQQQNAYYFHLK